MIQITKIFRFETAHAIQGYSGKCCNIHGHSYELHVTVSPLHRNDGYIPTPGFVIDFKELKQLVKKVIIQQFDHSLILSEGYVKHPSVVKSLENIIIWEMEPTAENILLFISNSLRNELPKNVVLCKLKLYETRDSYAEWQNEI